MTGNGCARFVHDLLVRNGTGARDLLLGRSRCLYVVFALIESVPQHETQHGLRGAPGFTCKLNQAPLPRLGEKGLLHTLHSF